MSNITFFSNSWDFLTGVAKGVNYVNDSAMFAHSPMLSQHTKYKYKMQVTDADSTQRNFRFYNDDGQLISTEIV